MHILHHDNQPTLICSGAKTRLAVILLTFAMLSAWPMARAQSDQDRMEAAAKDFRSACVGCHGPEGRGDGPYVSQLRTAPPNLRKLSARNGGIFPTQEVYQRIEGLGMPQAHGTRVMPVWGALFLFEEIGESVSIKDAQMAEQKTRRRLERLVDYLKSIQE